MADNILRLKVESSEYDQKLANAAKGIRHLADVAHQGAGELTGLEKSELEYIKALGEMETKSRSASGKVRELSSTYKELKVLYDQLNMAEKADEGGKALAASLEQIKQRAQAAQTQLDAATQSLQGNSEAGKGTSSVMQLLKDKLTINIDAVKLFNVGLQAAEGALNVVKDAFFSNEEQLDVWGQTVESSKSLYNGFLDALNSGDISGFLNNIDNIVNAAREAYNAIDELGTFNAFNQINTERTRTGMTESIANYRSGTGSKNQVKAAGEAYKKELQERQKLEREAYLAAVGEMAAQRGVSKDDLVKALSGSYGSYQSLKALPLSGSQTVYYGGGMFGGGGSYEKAVPGSTQEKLGEALRRLTDTELQNLQALGAQAERTGNEIAGVDRQLARVLGAGAATGGRTRTGGRSGGTTAAPDFLGSLNNAMLHATAGAGSLKSGDGGPSEIWKAIVQGANGAKSSVDTLTEAFEALNKAEGNAGGFAEDGKEAKNSWTNAATAVQNFGAALAGIGDPAAKAAGTVAQAIASIALGFAMASKSADTVASGWGWLAWVAAGAAAMATTIATIHSLTGYAQGGIVKGNTYSGDQIYGGAAMVNAGELVLNRAQQSTLAAQLGSGGDSQPVRPYVSGEQIFLGLNSYLKRSGRGEIMTTKR